MSLTREEEARLKELESKYPVLTKPTEENFFDRTGRTLSQIPMGAIRGVTSILDIPAAAYQYARGKNPSSPVTEYVEGKIHEALPRTQPNGAIDRGIRNLSSDLVGAKGLNKALKATKATSRLSVPKIKALPTLGASVGTTYNREGGAENPSIVGDILASMVGSRVGNIAGKLGKLSLGKPKLTYAQKDKYIKEAVQNYKDRTSAEYKELINPVETYMVDNGIQVRVRDPIQAIPENVLRELTMEELAEHLSDPSNYPGSYPRYGHSWRAANLLKEKLQREAALKGAFDINTRNTARLSAAKLKNLKEDIKDAIPEKFHKEYDEANKVWHDRATNGEPIIEDLLSSSHVEGSPYLSSLKDKNKAATHGRFVLNNLPEGRKQEYAKEFIKELGLKRNFKKDKSFLKTDTAVKAAEKLLNSFSKRTPELQEFYTAIGQPNHSLARRVSTPSAETIHAGLRAGTSNPIDEGVLDARIKLLEERLGLGREKHPGGDTVGIPEGYTLIEDTVVRNDNLLPEGGFRGGLDSNSGNYRYIPQTNILPQGGFSGGLDEGTHIDWNRQPIGSNAVFTNLVMPIPLNTAITTNTAGTLRDTGERFEPSHQYRASHEIGEEGIPPNYSIRDVPGRHSIAQNYNPLSSNPVQLLSNEDANRIAGGESLNSRLSSEYPYEEEDPFGATGGFGAFDMDNTPDELYVDFIKKKRESPNFNADNAYKSLQLQIQKILKRNNRI